jgi:ribosomal protein S18 acetylase RimI-like enzyme
LNHLERVDPVDAALAGISIQDPHLPVSLEPVCSPAHFAEVFEIIYPSTDPQPYAHLDRELFEAHLVKHGLVHRITHHEQAVGMLWAEEKGDVLMVHGLVIRPEFRSRGFGAAALHLLAQSARDRFSAVELLVHSSNPRARSLYRRLGFRTAAFLPESSFYRMRCNLDVLLVY